MVKIFTIVKYQEKLVNLFFISNLIDSVFRTGKNYYPQVFIVECKQLVKDKKIPMYINDDIEISSN